MAFRLRSSGRHSAAGRRWIRAAGRCARGRVCPFWGMGGARGCADEGLGETPRSRVICAGVHATGRWLDCSIGPGAQWCAAGTSGVSNGGTASVRREERATYAREAGAHEVVVGEDLSPAAAFGPYHMILESVGGTSLATALTTLALDGMCVLYGTSSSAETTFDARWFFGTGGASLYGFTLFHEIRR